MGGYGYSYQGYSSYSSGELGRTDEALGPLIRKPFVPFVPGRNSDAYLAPNANRSSEAEGYVTKKTIVPVASSPYGYGDEYKHSSPTPTQAYPARNDEGWRQQTSPAHGRPQKVDDFLNKIQIQASRPAKFGPETNWRDSQQSPPYNGANGYGDSGNFSSKPIGNTIRNDNYDGYNGPRGYGDSGKYGKDNGYGGDYGNKEGYKPTGSTIRNDNYDGYNGARGYGDSGKYGNKDNGYGGDYGNKEGYKPTGSIIRNDNYDGYNGASGYGDYGNKDNGYGGDYGNYGNKEGYKPTGSTTRNDNYDRHQPAGNYSAVEPNKPTTGGWTRPNTSGWTPPPRNGTQLSEATNDLGKAMELLKEAGNAKVTPGGHSAGVNGGINGNGGYGDYGNKEGYRANGNTYPNDNYDNYPRRNDGGDRPNPSIWAEAPSNGSKLTEPTSNVGKAMNLVKEADRLKSIVTSAPQGNGSQHSEPTNKIGQTLEQAERIKNIVTAPSQSRATVPIEATTPNKDDYRENNDSREATRRYGNFNFSSPPPSTIIDGREANYRENIDRSVAPRRFGNLKFGPTINSTEAEKRYKGTRV